MGLEHYKQVWNNYPNVKGSHKLILLALAEFANDDGECWPSIARLADMTGLKERQVQKLLRDLEQDGYIQIDTNYGRKNTNTYRFVTDKKVHSSAPFIDENVADINPEKVHSKVKKVHSSVEKGALECTRSIIEPSDSISSDSSKKSATPQQEYFGALCWLVGWDSKVITKEQAGQVAQVMGILQTAGYTLEDLRAFWRDVWAHDWRWAKKKQRPTLSDVRANIGKLRSDATMQANAPKVKSVFSQDFTESEA